MTARARILMVSGGSDSMAMLHLMVEEHGDQRQSMRVLHVNHLLRGQQAYDDEAFVLRACAQLGVDCVVRRVDVAELARSSKEGMEAVARRVRYQAARQELERLCAQLGVPLDQGAICTAHTLDDRVETFLMRTLVGTGPGGLGSIPEQRGCIQRPVIRRTRQELRDYLRQRQPGLDDGQLWRDDPTNDDGSNFRSQVRTRLVPVMEGLRPGFARSLERTMDLIADEDAMVSSQAESLVARNLQLESPGCARIPVSALTGQPQPLARRMLRQCLLAVDPDARLESAQIQRVLQGCRQQGFATEVAGGIRVDSDGCALRMRSREDTLS